MLLFWLILASTAAAGAVHEISLAQPTPGSMTTTISGDGIITFVVDARVHDDEKYMSSEAARKIVHAADTRRLGALVYGHNDTANKDNKTTAPATTHTDLATVPPWRRGAVQSTSGSMTTTAGLIIPAPYYLSLSACGRDPTMPTMHPTVIVDSLVPGSARVAASDERPWTRANAQNAPSHANGPGGTPPSQRGTDHDETITITPRRRQQRPSWCDRPYQRTPRGRHTCSRTIAVWWIAAAAVALLLHVAMRGASLNGAALFKLASSCHKTNGTGTACRPASEPFGGENEYTQKGSPRGEEGCIDGT